MNVNKRFYRNCSHFNYTILPKINKVKKSLILSPKQDHLSYFSHFWSNFFQIYIIHSKQKQIKANKE